MWACCSREEALIRATGSIHNRIDSATKQPPDRACKPQAHLPRCRRLFAMVLERLTNRNLSGTLPIIQRMFDDHETALTRGKYERLRVQRAGGGVSRWRKSSEAPL
jgi:hypothetical protein